jgi:hypothetical protein
MGWTQVRAAFDVEAALDLRNPRKGNIKDNTKIDVNGGGQECPPYT